MPTTISCQKGLMPAMIMAFCSERHEQHPQERAEDGADAAGQAGAAEHHRGDDLELDALPASTTAVFRRDASSAPARPASSPMITKQMKTVRSTLMPESFAARALPPM